MKKLKTQLLSLLLLVSSIVYSQEIKDTDTIYIYNRDYIKVAKSIRKDVIKTLDSMYIRDPKNNIGFYLIDIKRKDTIYARIKKINNKLNKNG